MFHTILVPLDGSAVSEEALPVACDLARRSAASLDLAHVSTRTMAAPIFVEGLPVIDADLHSLGRLHDRAYLEQIRDRLATEHDLPITVSTLDQHTSADHDQSIPWLLARQVVAIGADLIVMTTHGRGGLSRFWLGSVADALVRLSPAPVLLLHVLEGCPIPSRPAQVRRILIPLDGSERSEAIMAPALALGQLLGAVYTLLRVVVPAVLGPAAPFTTPTDFDPERTSRDEAEAQRYLDTVAGRMEQAGAIVRTRVRVTDQVASAILEESQSERCDMIALSTAGRSGLRRLMIGSVADKVLRRAEVPLLLHRDDAAHGGRVTGTT
jgi:nucleotide-binding universal stress UspA family protein